MYRYCCLQTYETEYPCEEDEAVIRSSSVEFIKKSLSFYMPNRLQAWNDETKVGNPTRSVDLNDLIKRIKKSEVRGIGIKSQAVRPMEDSEYDQMVQNFLDKDETNVEHKFGISGFMNMQSHMVARLDDTARIFTETLKVHGKCIVYNLFSNYIFL